MKLLFDENISPRLATLLGDVFPESKHVHEIGLGSADDATIWNRALVEGYTIVTKDSDFHERSLLVPDSPRVVWIRRGNCSTDEIALMLRANADALRAFAADRGSAVIALY